MKNEKQPQLNKDLSVEIGALEKRYRTIADYLKGAEMPDYEAVAALQVYKDDLSAISAHILTLYQLRGQRAKITWDSLFTNIDTALETIRNSTHPKPRATIETALKMSEPKIEEVMAYLASLKRSL